MALLTGLRARLIGVFVLLSLTVAAVMIVAVDRLSAAQIKSIAMASGLSELDAEAMFNRYIGGVLLVGAAIGVLVGGVAAWWLLRRLLRPLDRLAHATRAVASGDLAVRVPPAPDDELQALGASFNVMAASLQREDALRRRLVEDVAHELRTPLTTLQGYVEGMVDGVVDPTPSMLRSLHEEIVRLTKLVEDLDRLGRDATRSVTRTRTHVDIGALVERIAGLHHARLAALGKSLTVAVGAALPPVVADADGIRQVVGNLIDNAARYGHESTPIGVSLTADGESYVRCAVENAGITIPAADLPFIWERLYRVDRSRSRDGGGSGIGLAVVRQIVEEHGGSVGAHSADGRTCVWFTLPVTPL